MKKLLTILVFTLASVASACPARDGLFNGAVHASIYGLQPYCTVEGKQLQRDFIKGYKDIGIKVNYTEGYRYYATDETALKAALKDFQVMLESLDYSYVRAIDGDYTTQFVFEKLGNPRLKTIISAEEHPDYIVFMITNGVFPAGAK